MSIGIAQRSAEFQQGFAAEAPPFGCGDEAVTVAPAVEVWTDERIERVNREDAEGPEDEMAAYDDYLRSCVEPIRHRYPEIAAVFVDRHHHTALFLARGTIEPRRDHYHATVVYRGGGSDVGHGESLLESLMDASRKVECRRKAGKAVAANA